jgi:D-alanyl-D-alanine carboxypeptidase
LLGRIKGVDGIKTGYTRASGFNLVSSVEDGGRSIVGVVIGGSSGGSRDAQMAQLIKTYLPKASTRDRGPLIAKATSGNPISALAKVFLPKHDAPTPDFKPEEEEAVVAMEVAAPVKKKTPEAAPIPVAAPVIEDEVAQAPVVQAYISQEEIDPVNTASVPSGWAVQVASSPSKTEALAFLDKTVKEAPKVLASASGFTVPYSKGGVTYFRARFGGFGSKDAAWKACTSLKKHKIECYAVQQ